MKKFIKIEFQGQSKSVVATTKIEYELEPTDTITNEDILKESIKLYNEANAYADALTKKKLF